VTWHGVGGIRFGDVPDPRIEAPTDAIMRTTISATCGTDLHFGRLPTRPEPITDVLVAYREFSDRAPGRLKVARHV
jgi:threonine dehydrogenase-like Zn-dependent dehydrogenase